MADRRAPVAIVGAGFSGTMVAANLARRGIESVLIDSEDRAGRGTAFSTEDSAHLLNIPAEAMGAWADRPGDFSAAEGVEPGSYAERRRFGRYLRSILNQIVESGQAMLVQGRAVRATRAAQGWRIEVGYGGAIESDALVLAIGNQPPAPLPLAESAGDRLIDDPWGERTRAAIDDSVARQLDVLIMGTSLTMIDVALSLASAGHEGRIVALSRRGKVPLSNGVDTPAEIEWEDLPRPRVREIARWLRKRSGQIGWRAAVDSLRPHSHRLWQSLPIDQKRLFLSRGRPWWDIHRHRVAPQISRQVDELISKGQLELVAGRLLHVSGSTDSVEATIRRRGRGEADPPRRFGYIFNCTGPLGDISRTADPLLRQLLDDGLARPDELSIGLAVDERSRAAERLWALGSLTKGRYWEMIAIPDIRTQAAAVADDIATELAK